MDYLYAAVAILLVIILIYYFVKTDSAFCHAASVAKIKADTEIEMSPAFIKVSVAMHQFRQLPITEQKPYKLQLLIDEQDLLCEELQERLEDLEIKQDNVSALKF